MKRTRVARSDLERGRVSVNSADLGFIAAYYEKPINYFFPPDLKIDSDDLTPLGQELYMVFSKLPVVQQRIALEYLKKQLEIINNA